MSFSNISSKMQAVFVVAVALAITVAAYFTVYKSIDDSNRQKKTALQAKIRDNDMLRPYEKNMNQLVADTESLKQQLERQKLIVPDEKEADQFMRVMQNTAAQAGIEIRRYTSKSSVSHEFYTEVPFDIELDGPYYSMLNFFERVAKLERIINIGTIQMGSLTREGGFRKGYQYAPQESVGAKCVATTFFSREAGAAPEPTKGGKGAKTSKPSPKPSEK
jgi:type IV pilus assembly protein PilO